MVCWAVYLGTGDTDPSTGVGNSSVKLLGEVLTDTLHNFFVHLPLFLDDKEVNHVEKNHYLYLVKDDPLTWC